MIRLSTLIETFKKPLLAQYRDQMLPSQLKALAALGQCRTRLSPRMQAACPECDEQVFVPHSCGHRSCPHCQAHESQQWIERQTRKLVPGEYYLLTFTLPAELRALAFAHQRTVYDLLMQVSWETLKTFSLNDKALQGIPGAVAVLHTHTRRLDYHPHVHAVMPAGAIDGERGLWRTKRRRGQARYLFPHKALARVFRARMLAAFAAAGLTVPSGVPPQWVVDCRPVGTGAKALVYLGRYLYRGVIQEKDILACDAGQVTFRYRNAQDPQKRVPDGQRRGVPAPAAGARAAQGTAPRPQLRLPARQQQKTDCAPPDSHQAHPGPRADPSQTGVVLPVLRHAHDHRAYQDPAGGSAVSPCRGEPGRGCPHVSAAESARAAIGPPRGLKGIGWPNDRLKRTPDRPSAPLARLSRPAARSQAAPVSPNRAACPLDPPKIFS